MVSNEQRKSVRQIGRRRREAITAKQEKPELFRRGRDTDDEREGGRAERERPRKGNVK